MNKVLLTLSIMVLSGSLLAQESPTTPKAARVQIIQGPEIALASWFTVIRALWYGPQGPEPNRQKSDQVEPLPFIDGFPRAPVQPQAADDLLLHGGLDGVQRPERRSHQSSTKLHNTVVRRVRTRLAGTRKGHGCLRRFQEI